MKFSTHLSRWLAVALLAILPLGLIAEDDSAETEAISAEEVAYWKTLQAEIAAFRSANSSLPPQIIEMSIPQLNAAMDRIEEFLDERDFDEIDDFSEDMIAYHEQLMAMFEAAIPPLREGAAFQEQENRANPMARMMAGAKAINLMGRVDDYKRSLSTLHEKINAKVVAAGGSRVFFFQSLNLSDKGYISGDILTPEQRDERFVAESTGIDEGLGAFASEQFIPLRRDGRSNAEISAIRDKTLELFQEFAESLAQVPTAQIEADLARIPEMNGDTLFKGRIGFALRQELVRRDRESDAAFRLIDWKASFARWLGEAKSNLEDVVCTDIAVSPDGGYYCYSPQPHEVVVRLTETNELFDTRELEGEVRGLAFDNLGRVLAFTTKGLLRWDPDTRETPYERDSTTSINITGAIAAASGHNRFVQAWANIPAFTRGDLDSQLSALGSSNITTAALSDDGMFAAYGFSGSDNLGNGQKPRHGVTIIDLPVSDDSSDGLMSKNYLQAFIGPVTDVAFDADASHFTFCLDTGEVVVFKRGDEAKTRTQLTIDSQPYHYVTFVPGDTPHVLAAARNGVVRIWNYETKELLQRFVVPTGPAGVALAIIDDELVSVAIGSEALHRWDLTTGELSASILGAPPEIDAEQLAEDFATELALRSTIDDLRSLYDLEGEERESFARELLTEQGDALDQLGRRRTVVGSVASQIADRILELNKADKKAEAVEIGQKAIADGFVTRTVYYGTASALLAIQRIAEAETLLDEGLRLYPTSSDMRYLYHWHRMLTARNANNLKATLKEIDEIDLVHPKNRPHTGLRIDAHTVIAYQHTQAGNQRAALDMNLKGLDVCRTKDQQLKILPNAFSLAYQLEDWKTAVGVANMWLNVDPNKKNDSQFMEWARYAYSQANR